MYKTLSHSLIPNKVTGNLMESAKCKKAFSPLLDLQIITIGVPVPTPPASDITLGKNIFEEWNKFVDRYNPLLYPNIDMTYKTVPKPASGVTTQESVFESLTGVLAQQNAEASREIATTKSANNATNVTTYAQTVLKELRQVNNFFKGYLKQYNKINNELCPAIKKNKNI